MAILPWLNATGLVGMNPADKPAAEQRTLFGRLGSPHRYRRRVDSVLGMNRS